ncbi:hypothetical protein P4T89_12665 [Bacillus nakamurai]|uniref:Uncharacterized protein n=1 Tax=Bacillus nakamurai TaxID=1793963 RepID=A0A150FAY1_9BACI|nr:hypothetical protein [Bacillus nakamurai]KXZ22407.1 hypothetical protein AXI58_10480 [Bacillus nakamurai]MED1228368.1 hypothetical protein [Bacillus nakamurai]
MIILDQEVFVKSTGEPGIVVAIYPETNSIELCYYDGTYDERRMDDILGGDQLVASYNKK